MSMNTNSFIDTCINSVKSVQICDRFNTDNISVFSCIWIEYGDLYGVFSDPYLPEFGLNTGKYGPEKPRIWTLFGQ